MNLIDKAFEKAKEVLRLNITDRGFTACSVQHDLDPSSNYRSVWSRDSALTAMWSLALQDEELTACAKRSFETILSSQSEDGHLPNYVDVATGHPEYSGVGNIAGIDGPMWIIIAVWNYIHMTNDEDFCRNNLAKLDLTMRWLRAHDSNNCGLIEVPEASDWTDLFPRSYNVLYDEVLWYRSNVAFAHLMHIVDKPVEKYLNRASRIRSIINRQFWPTPENIRDSIESFASTQFNLGRARYLIAQITPFGFSWRCDVYANIIASLYGVIDHERSRALHQFLRQTGVDQPYPVRVLYPAINPGDHDWRDYFLVNLQTLPHHYPNGGIWPFVGGLWVRFLLRVGRRNEAEEALVKLAEFNRSGFDDEWEFNEWGHGQTGHPMGKAYQAWTAASYVAAYLAMQGVEGLDVQTSEPEELTTGREYNLPEAVTSPRINLDRPSKDGDRVQEEGT